MQCYLCFFKNQLVKIYDHSEMKKPRYLKVQVKSYLFNEVLLDPLKNQYSGLVELSTSSALSSHFALTEHDQPWP